MTEDLHSNWRASVEAAAALLPTMPIQSRWFDISQRAIDDYSRSVLDPDPVHIDPDWAKKHTPYGGTIAAGMWGASMLVAALHETRVLEGVQQRLGVSFGLNYGFDRLRFVSVLPVGKRVRALFENMMLRVKAPNQALLTLKATAQVEGATRPAVVGDWLLAFVDAAER